MVNNVKKREKWAMDTNRVTEQANKLITFFLLSKKMQI